MNSLRAMQPYWLLAIYVERVVENVIVQCMFLHLIENDHSSYRHVGCVVIGYDVEEPAQDGGVEERVHVIWYSEELLHASRSVLVSDDLHEVIGVWYNGGAWESPLEKRMCCKASDMVDIAKGLLSVIAIVQ